MHVMNAIKGRIYVELCAQHNVYLPSTSVSCREIATYFQSCEQREGALHISCDTNFDIICKVITHDDSSYFHFYANPRCGNEIVEFFFLREGQNLKSKVKANLSAHTRCIAQLHKDDY